MIWLTSFTKKPKSYRNVTIFLISSISLNNITNVVVTNPKSFLWIPGSAADTDVVGPNVIKTFLAKDWSTFFINNKQTFINGPKYLPRKI